MQTLKVRTDDGVCPVFLHMPAGVGPWPGVLLYMDGPGMRPAVHRIAERLAGNGYCVVLPDLFYRAGPYPPLDPKVVFGNASLKAAHRATYMAGANPKNVMADTRTLFAKMGGCEKISAAPYGVVGYCMGGRLALIAAGTFPNEIAVAASYHGGGLADDTLSSPHLLASAMKAKVYIGGAVEDANFSDDMKQRLGDALAAAGVDHLIETYPAKHGWVPDDTAAHDRDEAEHHWRTLVPLLDSALKRC